VKVGHPPSEEREEVEEEKCPMEISASKYLRKFGRILS